LATNPTSRLHTERKMNDSEIEDLLRVAIGPRFLGVFTADNIPLPLIKNLPLTTYPYCFIANTDPDSEPGSHWVAFYVDSSHTYEFFDSYAISASTYFAKYNSFLAYTPPRVSNSYSLQKLNSVVCGHYCIYYLYLRLVAHQSLASICRTLYPFSQLTHSDKTVKSFVDQLRRQYFK